MNSREDIVSLGNKKLFELAIGRRKTKSELLSTSKGEIPIISARLDKPFGFVQSNYYICENEKLVLWNIDSSRWDTRCLDANIKFIPTDHCGYMKILDKDIVPEYIAYKLYEQGLNVGFKHEYRASLKNIGNISISIPINTKGRYDVKKQREISSKFYDCIKTRNQLIALVDDLSSKRMNISSIGQFASIPIGSFMHFKKGKAKYIEKYCHLHKGEYPVYSAGTKERNTIGEIDTYDYDVECLKITTNGHYAGTVEYIPKSKFSLNGDVGILIPKNQGVFNSIDFIYLEYALQRAREQYGFNWNNKPSQKDILAIEIQIPIKNDEQWDVEEQKRIASKYLTYKQSISELILCADSIKKRFVKID